MVSRGLALLLLQLLLPLALAAPDPRNASHPFGTIFAPPPGHSTAYSDQPQVVIFNESFWLCVVTCSPQREGQRSQIAATVTSTDRGRSAYGIVPEAGAAPLQGSLRCCCSPRYDTFPESPGTKLSATLTR